MATVVAAAAFGLAVGPGCVEPPSTGSAAQEVAESASDAADAAVAADSGEMVYCAQDPRESFPMCPSMPEDSHGPCYDDDCVLCATPHCHRDTYTDDTDASP